MTPPRTFSVVELVRTPEHGPEDRLSFAAGVNVIVGMPNTGKSKWLQMLNYLLVSEDIASGRLRRGHRRKVHIPQGQAHGCGRSAGDRAAVG